MKRILFIGGVCVLLIAPLAAKIASDTFGNPSAPSQSVAPSDEDELRTVFADYNNSFPEEDRIDEQIEVRSFERMQEWWYIVKLTVGETDTVALVSKFNDSKPRIVVEPFNSFPYGNISGSAGVPYDVIDKFNEEISLDDE